MAGKICPIANLRVNISMVKSPDCLEYKCAWYKNSRCAIINIAEQLEEAQRNILKTALNKPDK